LNFMDIDFKNKDLQRYLLKVARDAIAKGLGLRKDDGFDDFDADKHGAGGAEFNTEWQKFLKEKRGVFVTLEKDEKLRGCIGHIFGVMPLIDAIKQNAVSAAFEDPRFNPLTRDEFADITIEISVLSIPQELEYDSPEDLKEKLKVDIDGVVLIKGFAKATYLPQVWDTFKKELGVSNKEGLKETFLSSLCMKAGLAPDEWMSGSLKVETYQAEVFKEGFDE